MLIGAHSIIYSRNPDADRAFLRDVLGLPNVDVGEGWLIFGLPPSEVAVHPSAENNAHEFYLMCDDVEAFVADMKAHGVACSAVEGPRLGAAHAGVAPRWRSPWHLSAQAREAAGVEPDQGGEEAR